MAAKLTYPTSRRSDHADDYHGTRVPDPYRWLEDAHADETRAWTEAQNDLTLAYLNSVPARDRLRARLGKLMDFPRSGAPWQRGGRYFRLHNGGLQNQDVLWVAEQLDGPWRELLDPNLLSADGTVALNALSVSEDGRFLAYAVSAGGSDWQTWRVRRVQGEGESAQDLPETLSWSKFSGAAWLPDGSGFFYGRYPEAREGDALTAANYGQQLYLHRFGTDQAQDELVYERPDRPEWGFDAQVSHDGRFLILHVWQGTDRRNLLFYKELRAGGEFVELVSEFEASYRFVADDGGTFCVHTDDGAPRGKLIAWNLQTGERRDVIPEGPDKLEGVWDVPDGFLALYLSDAAHCLGHFDRAGRPKRDVALPTLGSVSDVHTRPDSPEVFFSFTSFLYPTAAFRLDVNTGEPRALETPHLDFDPSLYEMRQLFATGRDGTRVPLFVTCKKGLTLSGDAPTLLYGYGGFNISLTPSFSALRLPWLELGGVLAVANLRGGGEYGEEWHAAGTRERKQNVFDDFVACAELLIARGYTRPAKLAIEGRSNGGLLVGAVLTQRPDLFGAALPGVGVLDMLRFHRFTIGWAWVPDYGSSDDPAQFGTLLAYSPLHNLKEGERYPATLITTGDHDDRVVPAHSFKFAAAMQHAQGGDAPVLIRVQTRAGHGAGKPLALVIEEQADIYAFLLRAEGRGAGAGRRYRSLTSTTCTASRSSQGVHSGDASSA